MRAELERAGMPRSVAMTLTGHKSEVVYRRYTIVNAADQAQWVAKLAEQHAQDAQVAAKVTRLRVAQSSPSRLNANTAPRAPGPFVRPGIAK